MSEQQNFKKYQHRLYDLKNSFWDLYEMFIQVNKDEEQHKKASILAQNVLKSRVLTEGIDFKQN